WSNKMVGSEDPEYIVSDEEIFNAQVEMFMYAQQLADQRRAEPRDDIISALLSAEVDGDSLSDMDFNLFFLLLSVAGTRPHATRSRTACTRSWRTRTSTTFWSQIHRRASSRRRRRSCGGPRP